MLPLLPHDQFQESARVPIYLHHTVVPEVQSHGFNFADVWEVAVDARAMETDENPQLVRGPIRICGVEEQDLC